MYAVAIIELASAPDVEAAALAATLGGTPYEHRLHLLGGTPAIVLSTPDRELAQATLAGLRQRGHAAVACDTGAVVPSERMRTLRRFRLERDALWAGEPELERLPGSDMLALLRALHRTEIETRSEVRGKQLSVGRAIATGGLVMSKSVRREQRASSTELENVLYIFRKSGEPPWLLRERATNYSALGAELGASSLQNFITLIRKLRELAPRAAYDERLMKLRRPSGPPVTRGAPGAQSVTTSTASALDLGAHLLALWYRR